MLPVFFLHYFYVNMFILPVTYWESIAIIHGQLQLHIYFYIDIFYIAYYFLEGDMYHTWTITITYLFLY
jgi:hypothetical protein